MERGQDARLMSMIVSVMKKAERSFLNLDKVAVTRGPGSFTGTRVGLATARGIALASRKPIIGIDRFGIYRTIHSKNDKNLLVVIDSKRAELFCQFFPTTGASTEAVMMTQEKIEAFLNQHPETEIVGDMATPKDDILSVCAALAANIDDKDPAYLPRPLYLRAPNVSFAKSR
jgi:tRNA threonylcarbamoyladenosine biosynthesis protein TsaB